MKTFETVAEAKHYLRMIQGEGLRVGLVPTMGALHEGHLSLVRQVRAHADVVVASIFVNPKQFGPNEDFARYPRELERDVEKLASCECDAVFAPAVEEMYPEGFETQVEVTRVSLGLEGDVRPGHFRGVATVVLKLLNIIRPDAAIFGEKDFQQLAVIRAMARDLAIDTEIVGAPLIRDPDGLALSSRNAFLTPADRARALALSRGLFRAREAHEAGERSAAALVALAGAPMREAGLSPEYLEVRHFSTLRPVDRTDEPSVLLVAARVGSTRLIDNVILRRP